MWVYLISVLLAAQQAETPDFDSQDENLYSQPPVQSAVNARFEVIKLKTSKIEYYVLDENQQQMIYKTQDSKDQSNVLTVTLSPDENALREFAAANPPMFAMEHTPLDRKRLAGLIDEFIVERVFQMDNISDDDSIQIDWLGQQILIFTSTEEEMTATKSLLDQLIALSNDPNLEMNGIGGPSVHYALRSKDNEGREVVQFFIPREHYTEGTLVTDLSPSEVYARLENIFIEEDETPSLQFFRYSYGFDHVFPYVKEDPKTGKKYTLVDYRVSWEFFEEIQNALLTQHDSIRVHYYPTEVLRRVEAFQEKHEEEMQRFGWWVTMSSDQTRIFYQLGEKLERELRKTVESIDTPPFLLLVEVSLLSVNKNLERELGIAFSKGHAHEQNNAILNILSNLVGKAGMGQISLALEAGSSLLDVTIDAIERTGAGSRQVFPSQTTIELTGDEARPIVFESKSVTPSVYATSDAISQENQEIGLGLTIEKIRVLENRAYSEEKNTVENSYITFLAENDDLHSAIVDIFESGNLLNWIFLKTSVGEVPDDDPTVGYKVDYVDRPPLEAISEYIYVLDEFGTRIEKLNDRLQIEIHAQLEDGSITRIVETDNGISAFFQKVNYEFSMIIPNGESRFLGGSSATQERKDKEKAFGFIPVRSNKSGSEEALVAFLTVSVLDDVTEQRVKSEMSKRVSIQLLRPDMLPNLPGLTRPIVPTATDLRSEAIWVYDKATQFRKLLGEEYAQVGAQILSRLFWKQVLEEIVEEARVRPDEWTNFDIIKRELDNLSHEPAGPQLSEKIEPLPIRQHPAVSRLWTVIKHYKLLDPSTLIWPQDVLAVARQEGWIGGTPGLRSDVKVDDRILWYLSYLVAKDAQRLGIMDVDSLWTERDIQEFEKILPKLSGSRWERELGSFASRMKGRRP